WHGSRIEQHSELQKYVLEKLVMGFSPEQIAGRMSLENNTMTISHESIYRFIYKQIAKYKDYSWRHYLPHAKSKRGYRTHANRSPVAHFKDRVSIHQRPQSVKNRDDFGHWECDLMMFSEKKRNLMVTQERRSRYVMLNLQSSKETVPLMQNLHKNFKKIPKQHIQTITFDNGTEFAHHYKLKEKIGIKTYFCDTYSPWQKGGVENMNRRLRRYLPRKSNLNTLNPQDILWLQHKMNNTPRKCLGFRTPLEVLSNALHFKCESTSSL
ncbi:MAG: IS30 family transposase, partial [Alphaproteobacteria bacterium]